jgi:hypothetical protein
MSAARPGRLELCLVATALAALVAVEVDVARKLSTTFDERSHLAAGFSAVVHRKLWLEPEQPPLVKLLAGSALRLAGGREGVAAGWWARSHESAQLRALAMWVYGDALIYGANPDLRLAGSREGAPSVLLAARLPLIAFPVLLALVTWAWARVRFGTWGGAIALALVLTNHDVLGHGALVTMDVPFAALALAATFALDRVARRGGAWLFVLALALALALAAKFTAVLLGPTFAVLALAAARRPMDPECASLLHPFGAGTVTSRLRALTLGTALLAAVAWVVLWLGYLGEEPLSACRSGLAAVPYARSGSLWGVCLDRYEAHIWWSVPVCLALKAPLGTLALLALTPFAARGSRGDLDEEAALHLPAIVILVVTMWIAAPIGTRYVIPAMPFLFVSAGRLAVWARGSRARTGVVVFALVANVVGVAVDHPFHTSSTNLLAGDPKLAYRFFDESNQDWGQALGALAEWQRKSGVDSVVVVSRIPNPDPAQLAAFGVRGELRVDAGPVWDPQPGRVYAVSAHVVARCRAMAIASARAELAEGRLPPVLALGTRHRPSEIVGGGFLIFDLR